MTDKTEVQERIRRAQQAILNPSRSIEEFLRAQPLDIEHNEHSFSQDFISARISGRDVDDLSFVDLPGIIASVRHGGREADIQDIRDLVLSFINKQNCLILLVVSCETDIENQGARELAKQVDPNGDRTIPVLTKPDRIATAAHRTWLELLENEQERFQHGWFCVKQSNQQQLEDGISWREARRNEVDFFENTAPWSGLDESIRRRLGTRALTEALGVILFDLICESLPELFREVLRKLQATKDAIRELPKKPEGDPIGILWKLLGAFQKDISQLVAGRPEDGDQGLLQLFRQYRLQFRESIFNQAPQFKPSPGSQKPLGYGRYINTAHNGEPLEPSVRDSSTVVDLNEVMNVAANSITRELPTNYPYAVKKRYVARFMAKWQQPTQLFFEKMERQFLKELKGLVTRHFEQYATGGLDKAILKIVLSQLEQCSVRTKERVEECLALEQEEPMTCNEQYLSHYKAQYLVRYKAVYGQAAQQLLSDDHKSSRHMQNVIDSLAELGVRVDRNDVFMRLCSSTNSNAAISEAAIDIMAEVSAYYQVAFKRYVDYVSLIIDVNLLKGLDRRIDQALIDGLTLGRQDARE
ncbi:hypothetical protein FRC17_004483, partial [Serendipita sp. 399]